MAGNNFFLKQKAREDLARAKTELGAARGLSDLTVRQSRVVDASARIARAEAILVLPDDKEVVPETKTEELAAPTLPADTARPIVSVILVGELILAMSATNAAIPDLTAPIVMPTRRRSSTPMDVRFLEALVKAAEAQSGKEAQGSVRSGVRRVSAEVAGTGNSKQTIQGRDRVIAPDLGNIINFVSSQLQLLDRDPDARNFVGRSASSRKPAQVKTAILA